MSLSCSELSRLHDSIPSNNPMTSCIDHPSQDNSHLKLPFYRTFFHMWPIYRVSISYWHMIKSFCNHMFIFFYTLHLFFSLSNQVSWHDSPSSSIFTCWTVFHFKHFNGNLCNICNNLQVFVTYLLQSNTHIVLVSDKSQTAFGRSVWRTNHPTWLFWETLSLYFVQNVSHLIF